MQFIFSTPVLIRYLWQLKTAVFLHRCLICTVPLGNSDCLAKLTHSDKFSKKIYNKDPLSIGFPTVILPFTS